jgi:hypothetical protein
MITISPDVIGTQKIVATSQRCKWPSLIVNRETIAFLNNTQEIVNHGSYVEERDFAR